MVATKTKRMKTYSARPSEIEALWQVLDASGRPLGRLAGEVARLLQGKHRPTYTPHLLTGDFVVVINASQVGITGKKPEGKMYYRYSGYHGGLKVISLRDQLAKHPDRVIQHAVKGMLPQSALGRQMLGRLKVYAGSDHPHQAQVTGTMKRQAAVTQPQIPEAKE